LCRSGAATTYSLNIMNEIEILEKHLEELRKISYQNRQDSTALKKTEMLIRKFFGHNSPYLEDYKNIRYAPPIMTAGGNDDSAWFFEAGLKTHRALIQTMIEDKKLSKTQTETDFDETILSYMRLAIECGKQSVGEQGKLTPKVGAVIVQDNKFLGSAFRGQKGEGDHAEYTLFQKILNGADVKGATLFTTLEPCTARGSHKPCSEWIIEKGIKHVYIGLLDPNPKIYNIGCKKLMAAGIEVSHFPRELRTEIAADNALFISQYNALPDLSGIASFNYTNNNGLFSIGNNDMLFETKWSKGSDKSIHIYNNPSSIKSVAIADGFTEIKNIKDGSIYDTSSRVRQVNLNEIVIIENSNGYFAALKVLDIKDKSRPNNDRDELKFEYIILPDKTSNFAGKV
jgi:pyrimidine deaminase RibD-like protein